MFGLFTKKTYKPTVTTADKDWIEENIIWFVETFGLDKLRNSPFILPTKENFPYDNLKDLEQFQKLFEQLCSYWDINPNEIKVKFFDDFKSKQWTTWIPHGTFDEPGGLYNQIYTTDEKRFKIELAKSNLDNPQLLVSVIAHELAHVKLLGGNYINGNDSDMEPLTDLASIFFGFGIFVANSCETTDIYWITRTGYLPNQLISYSNALICYITEHKIDNYLTFLNTNTKALFKQDFEFLERTQNSILSKYKVAECEKVYSIGNMIVEGYAKRDFESVIEASKKLLETNPKNLSASNNIGYALLFQKKYNEAIKEFNKTITIDPYFEYAYNNRGYCKLQLGDIDDAFVDIQSSFEMNPENSFAWRNMGAYYLKTEEFEKALEHFEEAEKINPKTELINFYLGHANLKIGNIDKAKQYFDKSKDLDEYNDSLTE